MLNLLLQTTIILLCVDATVDLTLRRTNLFGSPGVPNQIAMLLDRDSLALQPFLYGSFLILCACISLSAPALVTVFASAFPVSAFISLDYFWINLYKGPSSVCCHVTSPIQPVFLDMGACEYNNIHLK